VFVAAVVVVVVGALIALVAGLAIGGDDDGSAGLPAGAGPPGRLVIGALLSRTGPYADASRAFMPAITAAVSDVNDAGGVNGHPVRLVPVDDRSTPIDTRTAVKTAITRDHVDAFVGPGTSSLAVPLVGDLAIDQALTCSGSTTSSELASIGDRDAYFRTVPDDRLQALALARLVIARHPRRVVVLTRSGPTFTLVARVVRDQLRVAGVPVVVRPPEYDRKAPDFAPEALDVAAARPDAIVLVATDEAPRVVRALIDANVGPNAVPLFTTDDARSADFATDAGVAPSALVGIQGTTPAAVAHVAAPSFVTTPLGKGYGDATLAAYFYDCVVLEALAAQSIHDDDPVHMRTAMHAVSRGGHACGTFEECTRALARGADVDYDGLTGPVDLDAHGNPSTAYFTMWRYDGTGHARDVVGRPVPVRATTP
jgi:branched-chain amino acid transport system substrate-binding protein